MTWQDMIRIRTYQTRNPPLIALVRAIAEALGIKYRDPDAKPQPMTAQEAQMLARVTDGRVPDWAT